jgi:hypothetical protein
MNRRIRIALPAALMATGAAMIVLGILSGELTVILSKAIRICLECIGIG